MTIATLIITCVHLRRARLDRRRLCAGRAVGRRDRLHLRPRTPATPRRTSRPATSSARRRSISRWASRSASSPRRSSSAGRCSRCTTTFGIGSEADRRAAGDADGDAHQGPAVSQSLPWGLVLVGVFVSITLELCGIHSLSFAVGAYLPIATTAPIFVGGVGRAGWSSARPVKRANRI